LLTGLLFVALAGEDGEAWILGEAIISEREITKHEN
jgi:hypothetical protein